MSKHVKDLVLNMLMAETATRVFKFRGYRFHLDIIRICNFMVPLYRYKNINYIKFIDELDFAKFMTTLYSHISFT